MQFDISIVDENHTQFADTVEAIIDAVASDLGRPFDPTPWQLRATAPDGSLAGGLTAYVAQGWLYIRLLGVADGFRSSGLGRVLLDRAEEHARAQGLAGVYLDTYDFQAPRFYRSRGYTEFGRLPAAGGAPQRIWFAKVFDDGPREE